MSSGEPESISMRIPRSLVKTSGVIPRTMPHHSLPMISVTIREGWIHSPMLKEDGEELELIFDALNDRGFITLILVGVQVVGPSSSTADDGSSKPDEWSSEGTSDDAPTATPSSPSVTQPASSSPTRRSERIPYQTQDGLTEL